MLIVSVDFDGTITTRNNYPEAGEIRPHCAEVLTTLKENGYFIIVNTCRHTYKDIVLVKKTLNDIDISTVEGELLLAAIAHITCTTHTKNTPDEVIDMLKTLAKKMRS